MDVIAAMETCRAMRYLKPDPVPPEMIERLIYAATRAPSPGNSQGWDFVVVTAADVKAKIRDLIAAPMRQMRAAMPPPPNAVEARMLTGAVHLADSLATVPVLIFVCGAPCYPPQAPTEQFVWSALYPAAQNILVAARSMGLGSTLTTFHGIGGDALRDLLRVPKDVRIAAMIPLGWPAKAFGPVSRKPVKDVIHYDHW